MSVRFKSGEGKQLGDLDLLQRAVALGDSHVFAGTQGAVEDARNRQATEIVAVIQIGHQHLQRAIGIALGLRDGVHDGVEQRPQILARLAQIGRRRPQLGIGVEHGKIELILAGVEIDEQVVNLVQHFLRARVGTVDLVDHQNRRQLGFQRLAQHVARLRQRTFAGIDQQHHSVDHLQRALHLAAKVAVAGGVDDIDLDLGRVAGVGRGMVEDGGVLGQNGDAALALQFVGIHHPLDMGLVGAEDAALVQHGVHQRGLAVVNVRDDGDVANTRAQNCPFQLAENSGENRLRSAKRRESGPVCPVYNTARRLRLDRAKWSNDKCDLGREEIPHQAASVAGFLRLPRRVPAVRLATSRN